MNNILIKLLENLLNDLKEGTCELSDEELQKSIDFINQISTRDTLSKIEAYEYLNMSKSTFENWVKVGEIHKQKVRGFKELRFSKADLDVFKKNHPYY